ncbi:MAG: hypothetical protein ACREH4_04915 [Vitreimonas sp.]
MAHTSAPPEDIRDRVRTCAAVSEPAQRLACYDQLGAEVEQTPADAWSITLNRQGVQEIQREAFGLNLPNLSQLIPDLRGQAGAIDRVEMRILRIISHGDGHFTFLMDNGQRWTQTEPERVTNIRVGDVVTIRRGALTSFIMNSPRGGRAHRVRREN